MPFESCLPLLSVVGIVFDEAKASIVLKALQWRKTSDRKSSVLRSRQRELGTRAH
jgi:hypothetical protein